MHPTTDTPSLPIMKLVTLACVLGSAAAFMVPAPVQR